MENKDPTPNHNIITAIGYVVLATLFLAVMDGLVKHVLKTYSAPQIVWVRYGGQVFWVCVILLIRQLVTKKPARTAFKSNHLKLQVLRSLCLFGGTFCLFVGLTRVPLALGAAIAELAPVFVTILAAVLLRESVGLYRWSMVGVGLVGGLLIMKPFSHSFDPWLLFPLGTALCFSGYYITTRYLGSQDSVWTTLFYTALLGSVIASAIMIFGDFWVEPNTQDILIFVVLSLLGAMGHFFLILGFSNAPASILAPFTYMGLIWAGLIGVTVFAERPDVWSYLGAGLIVLSGIVIFYREKKASIKNRAVVRKGIR